MPRKTDKVDYVKVIKEAPNKNMDYLFVAFTFIISVLLIAFAIRPTVETVLTINKEIKEKENISAALDTKIDALSKLDAQYNEHKEDFDSLTLLFPTSGNFSLFLSNIEAVVSRNNFVLESVSFSDYGRDGMPISTSVLSPWSARLSVTGKRANIQNLLKEFEAMPMYPVIENFSYSDKTDDDGNLRYSVLLRIYHVENNLFYE